MARKEEKDKTAEAEPAGSAEQVEQVEAMEPAEPVEPEVIATEASGAAVAVLQPVSELKPNDEFDYGGVLYRVVSCRISVEEVKSGSRGEISPGTMVQKK
jgi:hypothetical protein